MAFDSSGGGWQWRVSVFEGNGQLWVLVFDGGNGRQSQQRWQWRMTMAFDGDI